ncbi:hypothetical protein MMC19_007272 [Ptychographa xylographoides]|nr:hypothetical protein [Ptychographa xylographoides]
MVSKRPKTSLSHEARLSISKQIIANMPKMVLPPKDFDPFKLSNKELVNNGLPPRPDKETCPKLRAVWESMMVRKFSFVEPALYIDETVHPPRITTDHDTNGDKANGDETNGQKPVVQSSPKDKVASGTMVFDNIWSGAVIPNPPSGQTFYTITAAWIIPNAYPPPTAKLAGGKFADNTYTAAAWIGLDGYGTPGVLQCGTTSVCTVSGGNITSQSAYAWYEWFPALPITVGIAVKPGDLMQCVVCGSGPTSGSFVISNVSSGFSTPSIPRPSRPSRSRPRWCPCRERQPSG